MRPELFYIPWVEFPSASWYILVIIVFAAIGMALNFLGQRKKNEFLYNYSYIIAAAAVIAGLAVWINFFPPPADSGIKYGDAVAKPVYGYGLMLGLSFIICWYMTLAIAPKLGFKIEEIYWVLVISVVSSLFGARLFHVISNPGDWEHFFAFENGGLVAYGGYFAAVAANAVYFRVTKVDIGRVFDLFAPALALGLGITRIGCFLRGCCYGKPTDSFLGVVFPNVKNSIVYPTHGAQAVYPTQLFESALGFALAGLLLYLLLKKRHWVRGSIFLLFFALYAIGRFLLEFIRDDGGRAFYFGNAISESQLYGVFVLIGCGIGYYYFKTHPVAHYAVKTAPLEPKKAEPGSKAKKKKK